MSARRRPEKADVQRLVVYPCEQKRSRQLILRVKDPAKARSFLRALVQQRLITDASLPADKARGPQLNIGFTFHGLRALGLDRRYLRVFQEKAPAFAEGAPRRAGRHLADTAASAAKGWEKSFREDRAHVLLTLHADTKEEIVQLTEKLTALPGKDGLGNWTKPLGAKHLPRVHGYRTVHFGLRDFISEPLIHGFLPEHPQWKAPEHKRINEPGEFLLGYWNDNGFNPWLLVNPLPAPNPWLPPLNPVQRAFFRNGSFGALRKMEQNEKAFRGYLAHWAEQLDVKSEYVKAKMTGRWEHGQLVKPGDIDPPGPPAAGENLDDFSFKDDPDGLGCPFGSHVRRMNPRNDPIAPSRLRPLIRRGMPYGPRYDEAAEAKGNSPERGLLALFFCASLEDQFEHLLAHWGHANPMGPANRGDSNDPLTGSHADPCAKLDIPVAGEDLRQLESFTRFVTTRGTLYAFFPGIAALGAIAAEPGAP